MKFETDDLVVWYEIYTKQHICVVQPRNRDTRELLVKDGTYNLYLQDMNDMRWYGVNENPMNIVRKISNWTICGSMNMLDHHHFLRPYHLIWTETGWEMDLEVNEAKKKVFSNDQYLSYIKHRRGGWVQNKNGTSFFVPVGNSAIWIPTEIFEKE